jgi:hypothetical protein
MLLVEYDIEYMTRKTVKWSVIIDYLADNTIDDYEPLNFDFLDEDVLVVKKKRTRLVDNIFWRSSKCIW